MTSSRRGRFANPRHLASKSSKCCTRRQGRVLATGDGPSRRMAFTAPCRCGALESFMKTLVATMPGEEPCPNTTGVCTWLKTLLVSYHPPEPPS